jgi:hypothetical protein
MNTKNVRRALLAVIAVAAALPLAAAAQVSVPQKISFDKDLHVPDAVRKECALDTKIPQYVKSAGGQARKGGKLEMKITGLLATGGGAFSGPKSVTVAGTLREGGKVTGTFVAQRNASAGAFGGGGTCAMLDRCAKAIGKDVGEWLKAPSKDAKLGDAK